MTSGRRTKARRRPIRPRTAHVEVICPGLLEILSVGKGDIKLTVGGDDPAEIAKAREMIEEMLRKGYGIFVETDKGVRRVKRFDSKHLTYIVSEVAAPTAAAPAKTRERRVPVAGSRAKAVGRTAGG